MIENKFEMSTTGYLFIITGVSGFGKTTIAHKLAEKYGVPTFAIDDYKVASYENYFNNDFERLLLRDAAIDNFKVDIMKTMRTGVSISVDYMFTKDWNDFFSKVCFTYDYKSVVVNCKSTSFDEIWQRKIERDKSGDRGISLKCIVYNELIQIVDERRFSTSRYNDRKNDYLKDAYTSIIGNYVFTDDIFCNLLEI